MKLNSSSLNIDLFCFNFNHISSFSWERIKSTNCWEFWWEENPFWIFKIHWFFFNKLFKIHWFRHHNHKQQKSKDIRKGAVDNWAKEQIPTPKLPWLHMYNIPSVCYKPFFSPAASFSESIMVSKPANSKHKIVKRRPFA